MDIVPLPKTDHTPLKFVVAVLSAISAILAVVLFISLLDSNPIAATIVAVCALLFSIGLWRLGKTARAFAVLALWILVIVAVAGTFNPFTASDLMAEQGEAPGVWQLAVWVAPTVIVSLLFLHVLGKYKTEFGKSRKSGE